MQALCHLDVQGESAIREIGAFLANAEDAQHETLVYADRLIRSAWTHRARTDTLMNQQALAWDVRRMSLVDRNVIRVALAELRDAVVPPSVVMDEAIEISREFSTADAPRFVNGLLDATAKAMAAETAKVLSPEPGTRNPE